MQLFRSINKKMVALAALAVATCSPALADEGMWLLPTLKQQNAAQLKAAGLMMDIDSIYSEDGVSMRDAVVIFGNGCTGELISSEGLLLTNHHCGYGAIQQHSSVEHDYLTDGFWAMDRSEELPTPGLTVEFIDKMEDVTDYVNAHLENDKDKGPMDYLSPSYLAGVVEKKLGKRNNWGNGIEYVIKPLYGGNKYYLYTHKIYNDVRMVGAPPSSIGKFGADTDNWMWPRHTGDFSLFRIYADAEGNPAEYSENNVPLRPKKWFKISTAGVKENDYAMIMGFPGSTNRFYTSAEVKSRKEVTNQAMIDVRAVRQEVLLDEMLADDKVRIQYASKYAGSSNYYKNAIGMNQALDRLDVIARKEAEEKAFTTWATTNNKPEYVAALNKINELTAKSNAVKHQLMYLAEALMRAVEFYNIPSATPLIKALESKDNKAIEEAMATFEKGYKQYANENYAPAVDRKVSKAVLKHYMSVIPAAERPSIFAKMKNVDSFVDDCFNKSIFSSKKDFEAFVKKPSVKKLDKDPMVQYELSVSAKFDALKKQNAELQEALLANIKTYIAGLMEMNGDNPIYPDANFTMRMTYGKVLPYSPKDGVQFDYYTTMKGIAEKEDPNNWEFVVPAKLKSLYESKDFGPYSLADGSMPVNFLSSNDITGGNSGSPVINAKGELIGCAFDGNWEAMSGDIVFEPNLQRTINLDVRYILFIIDKYAGAGHLIEEMDLVK